MTRSAVRGGFWMLVLRVAHQVLQIVKLIVLARVLAPGDFGLLGIALSVTATLQMFTETGFENALIQRKGDVRPFLDSAWTMLVVRGVLLAAILFAGAPLAAEFFRAEGATPIVRGVAFALLIESLLNIGVVYFKKELDFRRFVTLDLAGFATDIIVSIAAALILQNAWALVVGRIAGALVKTTVSYIVHDYRPRFDFDLARAKELFGFGKWILGSSMLVFALTQGDNLVVGRMLGPAALGLYQMAYRFSCLPATEITSMVSQVTFPVYSKLQDDTERLGRAYAKVLTVTSVLALLLAAGVFALAEDGVRVFMGEKWLEMVPAILVLVWFGVARGLAASMSPIFMSVGDPRAVTTQQAIQVAIMYALIFPLTERWGIEGTSIAVAVAAFIVFFGRIRRLCRVLGWGQWEFWKHLIGPSAAASVSIGATLAVRTLMPDVIGLGWLLVSALVFGASFGIVTLVGDRFAGTGVLTTTREVVRQVRTGRAAASGVSGKEG